jgi:hypothetical protein
VARSARRFDGDEVFGDGIENGYRQFSRFRHWTNALPVVWTKFDCGCGYETVTTPGRSHPKADRGGSSAPRLLWRRGLIRNPADQPKYGRGNMVNGCLTSLHTFALYLCFSSLTTR